jgi:hypothetical protein
MKRILASLSVFAIAACSPPEASQDDLPDSIPDEVSEEALQAWNVRLDDPSAEGAGGVQIVVEDAHLRASAGAAGLAWRPSDQVLGGTYRLSATFAAGGAEAGAVGLFVGGRNLPDPDRAYTSFVVGPDGGYRIARREGEEEHALAEGRATAGGSGAARILAVEVEGDDVRFLIDGETVETLPRSDAEPHGSTGVRLEEGVEVEIREWTLSRPGDASASGNPS